MPPVPRLQTPPRRFQSIPPTVVILFSLLAATPALPDERPAICDAPLKLRIEVIDPGFGVAQADVKSAIEQTANLWGVAAHRRLFVYDPKGEIAVNLIYDERQEAAKRYVKAQGYIQTITRKATVILNELKPLQAVLKDAEQSYSSQLAAFDRVKDIQALGGAGAVVK